VFEFQLHRTDIRKRNWRTALVFCALTSGILIQPFILPNGHAETAPRSEQKKQSKRTTINFEDQLIEGRAQKPELFVLLQNRMNNSRRLFKLRENFLPEMRKTAEDVGRAESNFRGSAEPAK
jgi:hypothetical protein